jgi:hypothetical protein
VAVRKNPARSADRARRSPERARRHQQGDDSPSGHDQEVSAGDAQAQAANVDHGLVRTNALSRRSGRRARAGATPSRAMRACTFCVNAPAKRRPHRIRPMPHPRFPFAVARDLASALCTGAALASYAAGATRLPPPDHRLPDPPPSLDREHRAELSAQTAVALQRQREQLAASLESALEHIPGALRGVVRRTLRA